MVNLPMKMKLYLVDNINIYKEIWSMKDESKLTYIVSIHLLKSDYKLFEV